MYCYKNIEGEWYVIDDDKPIIKAESNILEQGYIYFYGQYGLHEFIEYVKK